MCKQPSRDREQWWNPESEKDNFSSMKSMLVLLQIPRIGGEEPRYKSAGTSKFWAVPQWEDAVKINHMRCSDAFNDYQDGFLPPCRALLTKKAPSWDVAVTSRFVVLLFFFLPLGCCRTGWASCERNLRDSCSPMLRYFLNTSLFYAPKIYRFVCVGRKHTHTVGLAVAAPAQPAEAGSAHVYMQAYRAHVAHFFWNNQRLNFERTCLPHAKDVCFQHPLNTGMTPRGRRWE